MPALTESADPHAIRPVLDVLRGRRVVVLAGAGCSTESGIPDYRGPDGSLRNRKPMQYSEFVRSAASRARYWARSSVGWTRIATARPNAGHRALADLEDAGVVQGVITQNVDGLHHAAGSRRVVELHGSLARVRCLDCGADVNRDDYQDRLLHANPTWARRLRSGKGPDAVAPGAEMAPDVEIAPDGDAELPADAHAGFAVPGCDGVRGDHEAGRRLLRRVGSAAARRGGVAALRGRGRAARRGFLADRLLRPPVHGPGAPRR